VKNLIILIVFISSITNAIGQSGYFLSCENLKITEMRFDQTTQGDTLYITVYNDCDSCWQYVYTGLIVTQSEDTLALDLRYSSEWSPDNNTSRRYTLLTKNGKFDLTDPFKVGMLSACDSMYYSAEIILGLRHVTGDGGKDKVIINNDKISVTDQSFVIKDLAIYNMSGVLVQIKKNLLSSGFEMKLPNTGMYIVSLVLSNNENIKMKYMKLE
jgi:hypothetical protein